MSSNPLLLAAHDGQSELISELISGGININQTDKVSVMAGLECIVMRCSVGKYGADICLFERQDEVRAGVAAA